MFCFLSRHLLFYSPFWVEYYFKLCYRSFCYKKMLHLTYKLAIVLLRTHSCRCLHFGSRSYPCLVINLSKTLNYFHSCCQVFELLDFLWLFKLMGGSKIIGTQRCFPCERIASSTPQSLTIIHPSFSVNYFPYYLHPSPTLPLECSLSLVFRTSGILGKLWQNQWHWT